MTDQPVHVSHDVADLIALLPALFGFAPRDSVVGLCLHGERNRVGFRLRMDLPAPHLHDDVAAVVAAHLLRREPDAVVVLVLTGPGRRLHREAEDLLAALTTALVDVKGFQAVLADGRHYWTSPLEPPRRYDPEAISPAVAEAVLAGQQVLADRSELVARFAAVAGERRASLLVTAERVLDDASAVLLDAPPVVVRTAAARLEPLLAAGLEDASSLDDHELTTLAVWLSKEEVRNAVWSMMCHGCANGHLALWTRVAQVVVPPFEPAVLFLAAFSAWLTGDGAQALIAAERAAAADPGYEMAAMMLTLIEAGVDPRDCPVEAPAEP